MKKIPLVLSFVFIYSLGFCGLSWAYSISGEIVSIDLDVKAIKVKTQNPFTKKEFVERFVWIVDSAEGVVLRELKPGDFVSVRADKDRSGNYLVKKVIKKANKA